MKKGELGLRAFVRNIHLFLFTNDYLAPLLFGACAFLLVLGGRILVPTNIAWMSNSDPATYYLSWTYFRHAPWMMPPGANPGYGLDVASSIFYSDAIPVLALMLKLFSRWLPDAFQYWGAWLLLCFMLQSLFGWKLIGLATSDRLIKLVGAGLFVFSPPFLFRLNFHYALCGQWLILAALYLCLSPKNLPKLVLWPALAFLAAGVHSYIFAMITAVWIADIIGRHIAGKSRASSLFREAAFYGLAFLLMLWLEGFFLVQRGLAPGNLDRAHMDFLALLNPKSGPFGMWSYVLPGLPTAYGDYEGFNYMGLGAVFLLFFLLCQCHRWRSFDLPLRREWIPLGIVLGAMAVFSLSNRWTLGAFELFTYPMPNFCTALRAEGRMFWPLFYAGIFLLIRLLIRIKPLRTVRWVLAIVLMTQILDTGAGWLVIRQRHNAVYGSTWETPLKSPFWTRASSHYKKLYLVPETVFPDQNYQVFAMYAVQHEMGTDAVYLARLDPTILAAHCKRIDDELRSGEYDSSALYILDKDHEAMATKNLDRKRDLLENIDGFTVLAPDWNTGAH